MTLHRCQEKKEGRRRQKKAEVGVRTIKRKGEWEGVFGVFVEKGQGIVRS